VLGDSENFFHDIYRVEFAHSIPTGHTDETEDITVTGKRRSQT